MLLKAIDRSYPDFLCFLNSVARDECLENCTPKILLSDEIDLTGKNVLIVSSGSFVQAARLLKEKGARHVDIYISDGIMLEQENIPVLRDEGISMIFVGDMLVE